MKTQHLSKFSIFIISIVVIAISWYAVIVYTSPSVTSNQNERIYLEGTDNTRSNVGYARISNIEPNTIGYFQYPPWSKDFYQSFILIRLPAWLGGWKEDVSAFRAYSALDLTTHCGVTYYPSDPRQGIQGTCDGTMYRLLDGYMFITGGSTILLHGNNAIPQLDLAADKDGNLYVKPPKFTEDKNGVIGIGRKLSSQEIIESGKFMTQHPAIMTDIYYYGAPPKLTNGFERLTTNGDSYKENITYATQGFRNDNMTLVVKYCNCTKPNGSWSEQSTKYSKLWKVGDDLILATPNSVGNDKYTDFGFVFYKNFHKLTFFTGRQFEEGMNLTLDNFFNGTSISELQKVPIGQ